MAILRIVGEDEELRGTLEVSTPERARSVAQMLREWADAQSGVQEEDEWQS
jgi:hypothetical protein